MKKTALLIFILGLTIGTSYSQTLIDIVNENIKTRGGVELLSKLKTIESTNVTETPMGPMKSNMFVQDGTGYRIEFDMMGSTNFFLVTKDAGYMYMPISGKKDVTKMEDKQYEMMKQQLNINGELYQYLTTKTGLEMGAEEVAAGEPCWVINSITPGSPEPKKLYISKKSKQLIKESAQVESPEGMVEVTSFFSDFQKTPEGYILPMKIKNDRGETKIEKYTINPTFDANMFEPKQRTTKK